MSLLIDISNQQFGKTTVLNRFFPSAPLRRKEAVWRCRCLCGQIFVATSYNLRKGRTKSCGCSRGFAEYRSTETVEQRHHRLRGIRSNAKKCSARLDPDTAPTQSPSMLDIAWAAGLYEGEGSCKRASSSRLTSVATYGAGLFITVPQKDPECLIRLKTLFGGVISDDNNACKQWRLCGARARGFALTIFAFLTTRRKEQVRRAFGIKV